MASPQRADPGGPRRDFENSKNSGEGRGSPPRRRNTIWYWWWGFWVVIFAAAIGWGVWGAVNGNGWWFAGQARPGSVKAPPMNGPGVAALQAANKQPFVGQKFQANWVPVRKKINNSVFWVGAKNTTPTLMVLTHNANPGKNGTIQKGNVVDITGKLVKAPPEAQAQKQWALSNKGAARLEREGGYIQAKIAFYVPK